MPAHSSPHSDNQAFPRVDLADADLGDPVVIVHIAQVADDGGAGGPCDDCSGAWYGDRHGLPHTAGTARDNRSGQERQQTLPSEGGDQVGGWRSGRRVAIRSEGGDQVGGWRSGRRVAIRSEGGDQVGGWRSGRRVAIRSEGGDQVGGWRSGRRVAIRSEGGDQADQIDPQAPFAQDHSVQLSGGNAAAPTSRTGVSDVDALADLHRNLGRSMTSRLRCPQPLAKPWGRRLRGFLGWSGFRSPLGLQAGHPGRTTRFRPAFQLYDPLLQPFDDGLLADDDADEHFPVSSLKINFPAHRSYMT